MTRIASPGMDVRRSDRAFNLPFDVPYQQKPLLDRVPFGRPKDQLGGDDSTLGAFTVVVGVFDFYQLFGDHFQQRRATMELAL